MKIRKYIFEIIVIILFFISLAAYFIIISNKDKKIVSEENGGKNEDGLYPEQTYDSSIVDTDEFYKIYNKAISKKDFFKKQVVNINEEVKITRPFADTSNYDGKNTSIYYTEQCPTAIVKVTDVQATDTFNESSEAGFEYMIVSINVRSLYNWETLFHTGNFALHECRDTIENIINNLPGKRDYITLLSNNKVYVNKDRPGAISPGHNERQFTFDIVPPGEGQNDYIYMFPNEEINFKLVLKVDKSRCTENDLNPLRLQCYIGRLSTASYIIIIPRNSIKYEEKITLDPDEWRLN